jgi:hypothetical protein
MQTRRQFTGHLTAGVLALSMFSAVELGACSASSVFNDIKNWEPVAKAAVQSVVTILGANGFPVSQAASAVIALIEGGLDQVLADVNLYTSINPPPVGALAKIEAALGIVASNYQQFLQTIQVSNSPLLSTVIALAQVALSTIVAFEQQLPPNPTPAPASAARITSYTVAGQTVGISPKMRTRRAFKKDHNHVLDAAKKSGLAVPDSAYLKLTLLEHL